MSGDMMESMGDRLRKTVQDELDEIVRRAVDETLENSGLQEFLTEALQTKLNILVETDKEIEQALRNIVLKLLGVKEKSRARIKP